MIINYPTGLYSNVLPASPSDAGNVTFTISNNPPPRADLAFVKVPIGVVSRKKSKSTVSEFERRKTVGELIFTVSKASRSDEGNNVRQYELGQVYDFVETSGKTVDPMLVSLSTEIRHDTNIIDYGALGLTKDEQSALESVTFAAQNDLMSRLNEIRQQRANADEAINTNQKIINDTNKAITGLTVTMDTGAITGSLGTEGSVIEGVIAKLKLKRDDAFAARDAAITKANALAAEATSIYDQLRTVGTLVK